MSYLSEDAAGASQSAISRPHSTSNRVFDLQLRLDDLKAENERLRLEFQRLKNAIARYSKHFLVALEGGEGIQFQQADIVARDFRSERQFLL